ncbi:MAG: DNA polymerase III subunit chi [Gammaproteobacteria bacterium]|nr:DNA polymerase III subunit chi [Gammaproteobacteria bacterium]MDH5777973.1 DNA polymerase III subunit chi [Gammaproteobacteria bacterium]
MTRVDFYVLEDEHDKAANQFVCRLAEKAYKLDNHVYVHTDNQQEAEQLDQMMWTFKQGSFVPHSLYNTETAADCPVLIGHDHEPEDNTEVLINLSTQVPTFFSRYERIVELVAGDANSRHQARERYKFYRDRGYALETHNLSKQA